jgi:hypothetical protein
MTNRAKFDTKSAPLASDFGRDFAVRWFGRDIVDSLPHYVRGAKKGQPKGWIVWTRCTRGGWVNEWSDGDGGYGGHVARPGDYDSVIIEINFEAVHSVSPATLRERSAA